MVLASVQSRRQRHLPRGRGDAAGRSAVAARRASSKGRGRSAAMTGDDRAAIIFWRFPLLAVACTCSSLILSGCGELRTAMGIERTGPDEFAVESRAPLVVPPDFDLRPPQPGAPRPQEKTAAEKARSVIDSAGPGEPGKQAT